MSINVQELLDFANRYAEACGADNPSSNITPLSTPTGETLGLQFVDSTYAIVPAETCMDSIPESVREKYGDRLNSLWAIVHANVSPQDPDVLGVALAINGLHAAASDAVLQANIHVMTEMLRAIHANLVCTSHQFTPMQLVDYHTLN